MPGSAGRAGHTVYSRFCSAEPPDRNTMSALHRNPSQSASPGIRILRELLIVGIGYLIYSQVRGLAGDRVVDAYHNGYRVVQLEQDLGIFVELAMQTLILQYEVVKDAFNYIYFFGFFPLLLPTAAFLFWKRPKVYVVSRNAFLLSGFIAVIFFLVLPTAPPRLIGFGFIDTLGQSLTPTYDSMPGVNHFAAVPSMHVGWTFLTAVSIYRALSSDFRFRWLIWGLPLAMFIATVVTGNHYIVDGILGIAVAGTALYVATRFQRWSDRRAAEKALVAAEQPEEQPVAA